MTTTIILTETEFHDRFAPMKLDSGDLLDFRHVNDLPAENVWTIVEAEDDTGRNHWMALPGFHIVNKLGYVTSMTPWTDETLVAYYFEDDLEADEDDENGAE
jgi:hypothetical protein